MELHKGSKEYLKTILVLEQQSGVVRSPDVSCDQAQRQQSHETPAGRGLPDHGCGQTDPPDANRAHHSRTEHRKTPSPNGLPDLHGRRSCRCRTGRQRHGARHQLGNPGPDEAFCGYERTFAIVLLRTISYGNGASRTNAPFSAPGYVGVTSPKTNAPPGGEYELEALLASRLGQGLALTVHRTVIHYQTPALRAARNRIAVSGCQPLHIVISLLFSNYILYV